MFKLYHHRMAFLSEWEDNFAFPPRRGYPLARYMDVYGAKERNSL